ncbi:MAG: J domain-containing protein [Bdellovibrionota bacterium]
MQKWLTLLVIMTLFFQWWKKGASKPVNRTSSTPTPNPYEVLGVTPQDSWETIRKAYKEHISKNHPDLVEHLSESIQKTAKENMLRINKAFDEIKQSHSPTAKK